MKLEPRNGHIIGRTIIPKPRSSIIRPDMTKTTKLILIDAVDGDGVVKKGDIVLPTTLSSLVFNGGETHRPVLTAENIGFVVKGVDLENYLIQNEAGTEFVPFDSPQAAVSLGAPP